MSNTLKFGNGEWYGKEGTILAYNDENKNYKPLPFTFDRASSATLVNKDGLIETVGADQPRVDYLNNSKGALLLEPSRTNLITYSEDFSNAYWSKFESIITSGLSSPDGGLNAYKLIENNSNSSHGLLRSNFPINVQRTFSVFAKKGENDRIFISDYNKFGRTIGVIFNLSNGTVESNQDNTIYINPKIENFSNGWYRCSVTWTNTTGLTVPFFGNAISGTNVYQGNGVNGIFVFAAMFEEDSYSTSYIPTSGSAVTRLADVCNNGGNEQVFNDSQGGLYMEFEVIENTSSSYYIVSVRSSNGSDVLGVGGRQGKAFAEMFDGTNYISNNSANLVDGKNKIFLTYNSGNSAKLFLNGIKVLDFTGTIPSLSNLSELVQGDRFLGNKYYGNISEIKYQNTLLTDAQAIALTS